MDYDLEHKQHICVIHFAEARQASLIFQIQYNPETTGCSLLTGNISATLLANSCVSFNLEHFLCHATLVVTSAGRSAKLCREAKTWQTFIDIGVFVRLLACMFIIYLSKIITMELLTRDNTYTSAGTTTTLNIYDNFKFG